MNDSFKKIVAIFTVLLTVIYLINPTMGIFELIPDNIPFIGNLDEVGATGLLLSALKYLGYDFTNLFGKKQK